MRLRATQSSDFNSRDDTEGWQILFYYNLYRLGLTVLLVALASPVISTIRGNEGTYTVLAPILGIALISIVTFINIRRRWPALHIQAHLLFILDILFITVLTYSHVLLDSSTLIFYVTIAAATAVLFRLRISLVYTALCAAFILYNDFRKYIDGNQVIQEYYLTPLLLVGLFSVVVIVGSIANRSRSVKTVVEAQEQALEDLDQINQVVLEQLELGIVYLNQNMDVKMINRSARDLLRDAIDGKNRLNEEFSEFLANHLKSPPKGSANIRIHGREIGITALPLRKGHLVKIEDLTSIQRQIQQSKLVSVGRMATAISHEIRNPLSAITHAAQLLTPQHQEEEELIQIIRHHGRRIDEIIKSILHRSRPEKVFRKQLSLQPWLKVFIDTFHETVDPGEANLTATGDDATILFDPTQLEQIITNLCQNSIKYAKPKDGKLKIRFFVGVSWDGTPFLDVTDNGQGIEPAKVDQLFEPFQTSDSLSTGLGLFLVREFCTFNSADIEYLRGKLRHGFRMTFQSPEQVAALEAGKNNS